MKKILFSLALCSLPALADTPQEICDLHGASLYDPKRPADVSVRRYQPESDRQALAAVRAACTKAYESTKDIRYVFQRGMAAYQHAVREESRTMFADKAAKSASASLYQHGLQQSVRNDLRQAAGEGYVAAQFALITLDLHQEDARERFAALMQNDPVLAHWGLSQWHVLRMNLEADKKEEHRKAAQNHVQAVLDAGWNMPGAYLMLASLAGNAVEAIAVLERGRAMTGDDTIDAKLAVGYYKMGEKDKARVLIDSFREDDADGKTEREYLRGIQYLDGMFVEKDRAKAVEHLKNASRGGHDEARIILMQLGEGREDGNGKK